MTDLVASSLTGILGLAHAHEPATAETGGIELVTVPTIDAGWTESIRSIVAEVAPWLVDFHLFGRESWCFIAALVTVLFFYGLRRVFMGLIMRTLRKLSRKTKTRFDDELLEALDPPVAWFVTAVGLYLGTLWLQLPDGIQDFIITIYRMGVIVILGWALMRSTAILTGLLANVAERTKSDLDNHLVPLIGRIIRVLLVILIAVFLAQELGFNVGGLLAGLGVAGMAFALAAKDTLANWFGALMIYTDRPFDVGDWVKTRELEGVVEEIGLRSTKIRTFSKTVVSIPNSHLATDVIENFSRMPKRRIYFNFGVTYGTTPAMMRETLERIKDILRGHPDVDQSFWLVKFNDFGDSSLGILIYFFTETTNWEHYLAIREQINLQILEKIDEIGVSAAFPSHSVYMEETDPSLRQKLDTQARSLLAKRPQVLDQREQATAPLSESLDG
ncbi:MAG: mechanosensitive ion channel family protein [Nannocystaceae bacterium]